MFCIYNISSLVLWLNRVAILSPLRVGLLTCHGQFLLFV